jgi:hypothetical protein
MPHRMFPRAAVVTALGFVATAHGLLACGSASDETPSGQSLDCAWIESNNCWKQALAEVAQCIPQVDANHVVPTGTIAADALSCSYMNGPTVVFDEPVLPWAPETIAFEASLGGDRCYRFERDLGHLRLEVPSGVITVDAVLGDCQTCYSATITCADGSSYATDDYLATMQACEPDPSDWPGTVVEQMAPNLVGIDLPGGPGQVILFACEY